MNTMPIERKAYRSLLINREMNQKELPLKRKIKAQYIPKYRKLLNLSKKKVYQPSQDRLSQLTIKQIDRLIQMQKIKNLLNDNKNGIMPIHIRSLEQQKNKHPNVYQGNFLAKINRIALKRNVRHLRSQEFDENAITPSERRQKGFEMQKKNLRFVKQYLVDKKKNIKLSYQQEQQKSIDSIQNSVTQFQQSLDTKKIKNKLERRESLKRYRYNKTNILSATRWFNGMSTFYIDKQREKNKKQKGLGYSEDIKHTISSKIYNDEDMETLEYNRNFDYEYQSNRQTKCTKFQHSRLSTFA